MLPIGAMEEDKCYAAWSIIVWNGTVAMTPNSLGVVNKGIVKFVRQRVDLISVDVWCDS